MMKFIWEYLGFSLEYSNPRITPFHLLEGKVKDMNDVMYFYYTLTVRINGEIVAKYDSYDEHKVENVPSAIDYIVKKNMENELLEYERKTDEFEKYNYYTRVSLDSYYGVEYFFILERFQSKFRRYNKSSEFNNIEEVPFNIADEYSITVGEGEPRRGCSIREHYGKSFYIKNIPENEILRLKKIAESFVQYAIEEDNKIYKDMQYECEKCAKNFNYLKNSTDDGQTRFIKCPHCGYIEED